MANSSIKSSLEKFGIKTAIGYLRKNPEKNIPKLLDMIEKVDTTHAFSEALYNFRWAMDHPDRNWYKLIMKVVKDTDPHVLETFFTNFFMNSTMIGGKKQMEYREKYGCNIPWAILLDPTSACNLHCTGCWAAEYGNQLNLSFDEIDDIINQGTKMGTYMYIYTGGEPLVRKDDLIKLCEKHNDCVFLCFTNSTLIDDKFAEDMVRVGNFIPSISVEGFEEATDSRRGKGTFQKVSKAMDILNAHHLPFGVSCCYTSQNVSSIGSEEFFDWMIDKGAVFAWFFTYMPIGVDAPTDLMANAEQREFMYHKIRAYRESKALFTMDFWNDAEYVYGCIAGGRSYLHINANGDVEPCVFIHYSDSNIREKSLLDAYRSPMFMQYHKGQPFNHNMLRPCPVLDNPYRLEQMVGKTHAHCTDLLKQESPHDLCAKCAPVAERWKPVADRLWKESGPDGRHHMQCGDTILPENRLGEDELATMQECVDYANKKQAEIVAAGKNAKDA
ncbi:MAG: radical SAM protein [Oscillospiraceae bacterium]|jgi:MoaA/NifB/PqqE/SkfB family radical SAM enzyme|nr:radical SAM protein [Oscillospiraceae bacterium]MDD3260715.1 radical SAM protein [Oscillospiraceae bacterium]